MRMLSWLLVLMMALFQGWGMARAEGEGGARSLEEIEQHCTLSLPFLAEAALPDRTTLLHGENFYGYALEKLGTGSANAFTLVAVLDFSRYVSPDADWHLLRMEDVGNSPFLYYPMLFIPKPMKQSGEISLAVGYFNADAGDDNAGDHGEGNELSSVTLPEQPQGYVAIAITILPSQLYLYVNGTKGDLLEEKDNDRYSTLYLAQEAVESGFIQAAYTFDTALSEAEVKEYGARAVANVEAAAAAGTATPEPGTGSLLALSLAALAARRRRRAA